MKYLKSYWVVLPLMITKAQVKEIRALASAKGRDEQNAFLVEGDKLSREWLLSDSEIVYIIGTNEWLEKHQDIIAYHREALVLNVSDTDLSRISTLQTPNGALLVAKIPVPAKTLPRKEWCIALDTIQDPGNLGTIIRIADWFGVKHVICSPGCVDFNNPKVVGAAMGGHLRVNLINASLPGFLQSCGMPVFAATLNGTPVRQNGQQEAAVLIIGNESKGISEEVLKFATHEVTIPRRGGAESLNAAVSAGILLALLLPG